MKNTNTLHYCTLFDSNFMLMGLTMYHSLVKSCDNFHLYIFAFDDISYAFLSQSNLQHATVISLGSFEDKRLLSVKNSRTIAEYCWTSTPLTIQYCLNNFDIDHCIYLDADLFFFKNPSVLIDMLPKNKSVIITEHRCSPMYKEELESYSGVYNVQFMYFKNNASGKKVLSWWADRCIEWCFNRQEDGKFADQKYLNDWTIRFEKEVYVLPHLGAGIAAWNETQYIFTKENHELLLQEYEHGKMYNVIFYHFHQVKIKNHQLYFTLWRYIIPPKHYDIIYSQYIESLQNTKKQYKLDNFTLSLDKVHFLAARNAARHKRQKYLFISFFRNTRIRFMKFSIVIMKIFRVYTLYRKIKGLDK